MLWNLLVFFINDYFGWCYAVIESCWDFKKTCVTYSFSTVPADGLALLGARTSVGEVLTKSVSHICIGLEMLPHWGRVTHICVSELSIIGSDNGLSPGRRQAIILTNGGILLIRTSGRNFSEILSEVHTFSFKKMLLNRSSRKWWPFCLGFNVLTY